VSAWSAIIAEDEPRLADELCDMLAEAWPELVVTDKVGNGTDAVAALERAAPDVLFLDIQMPGLSGIDVARRASGRCHIVFVTAYDTYAIGAFEHDAADYLLNPVTAERLVHTVRRLKSRASAPAADVAALVRNSPNALRPGANTCAGSRSPKARRCAS
jgi:DNA-binding LytR/AlgR family response regulator